MTNTLIKYHFKKENSFKSLFTELKLEQNCHQAWHQT